MRPQKDFSLPSKSQTGEFIRTTKCVKTQWEPFETASEKPGSCEKI